MAQLDKQVEREDGAATGMLITFVEPLESKLNISRGDRRVQVFD